MAHYTCFHKWISQVYYSSWVLLTHQPIQGPYLIILYDYHYCCRISSLCKNLSIYDNINAYFIITSTHKNITKYYQKKGEKKQKSKDNKREKYRRTTLYHLRRELSVLCTLRHGGLTPSKNTPDISSFWPTFKWERQIYLGITR